MENIDISKLSDADLQALINEVSAESEKRELQLQKSLWEDIKKAIFAYLEEGFTIDCYPDFIDDVNVNFDTPGIIING